MQRMVSGQRPARWGLILLIALASACENSPTEPPVTQEGCAPDGSLSVAVFGAIQHELDWSGDALACDGMPRPDGAGARLRFAGTVDADGQTRSLAFIIGLPTLRRGQTAREIPANVTLIEEKSGRFFSTAEAPVCWSDVRQQTQIEGGEFVVSGILYCVSPLAELNGSGGVSFTDLTFSGRVDWGDVE